MKKLKTFFYSLKNSLFNRNYYKDISKSSFWFSFKYLWFLLFLIVFVYSLIGATAYLFFRPRVGPSINQFVKSTENFYPRGLELNIREGRLSTNVVEPYIIDLEARSPNINSPHFLIIDTAGSIDSYPDYNTYILATRNAVVYPSKSAKNDISGTSVFYFNNLKNNFSLNRQMVDRFIYSTRPYTGKLLYFVDLLVVFGLITLLFFGSFFWLMILLFILLIYTFFLWLINKIFKLNYSFNNIYRMGMHGVTWPLLTSELFRIFGFTSKSPFALIFFIWMLIVLFNQNKVEKKSIIKKSRRKSK